MRTIHLKSQPLQSWQHPTYYKVVGEDNNITEVSIWNATSLEITEVSDETFDDHIKYLKARDRNHPIVEIDRQEFDEQYMMLTEKQNKLSAA